MDLQRAFNEANARLRGIQEQLCCNGNYNTLGIVGLSSGENQVFNISTAHSISWNLGSGASITINNSVTTGTFTKEGSIEFSSLNNQLITISAVGGSVTLIWTY